MKNNINLLINQTDEFSPQSKIVSRLRLTAILLLIPISFISAVLFLIKTQLSLSSYQAAEKENVSKLSSLHDREVKLLLLNDRVKNISEIIARRPTLDKNVARVFNIIPAGIIVNSFKIEQKSVVFSLSSASLDSFDTFLATITQMAQKKDFFDTVRVDNLSTGSGAGYSLNLEATLL